MKPVTLRSVLIGLALIPPTAWWLAQIEYVRYSDTPTIPALFFHCIATLLILTGINELVNRRSPRLALSRSELLTVYSLQVIGSNLAGHDVLQILFTTLAWVYPRATPENRWSEHIHPHLPRELLPVPGQALDALFRGGSSLYQTANLSAWLVPLAWWSGFVLALCVTMLCLASLLRRQWYAERLSYPLAEIPLALSDTKTGPLRQPAFWIAFGLAASIQFLNLAHTLVPSVPGFSLAPRYVQARTLPWSAAGSIPLCYYPFALGLTFLLPTQLGFSCWFFFLLSRLELVSAAALGYQGWDSFPYVQQQGTGAYIGYALFALYLAKGHLSHVFRTILGWQESSLERGEPMPYRYAVSGLCAGILGMLAFLCHFGMRPEVATGYLVLFLAIVLTVARLRAEIGLPTIELYQRGADDMLLRAFGTKAMTNRELAMFSLCFWMTRTHRQFPMGHQLHAVRLAERTGLSMRGIVLGVLAATVLGIGSAFWALLHVTYQIGFGSAEFTGPADWAFGNEPWAKMSSWVQSPRQADHGAVGAYAFGAGMVFLLGALRARFLWWPLHPAGYVVASSFALMRLWLPLFVSWVVKSLLLRYGGLRAYRAALPVAYGLVAGEFTAGLIRTLADIGFSLYLPVDSGIGGL
ncbi:MAG: DUF6785 family protein [Armatimonadota bacterium]